MKTILFVPGYQDNFKSLDYASLFKVLENKGYEPKFIDIDWKRTTINDWVNQLNQEYTKYNPKDVILAGFSFGAMTALVAATKVKPSQLWLFSLSPYFAEDLKSTFMRKSWLKEIGKNRVKSFQKLKFNDLAKQINCPTLTFYGEKELSGWPIIQNLSDRSKKLIKGNKFIIVPNADHDVTNKNYLKKIEETI